MTRLVMQATKGKAYGGKKQGPIAAMNRVGGQVRHLRNLMHAANAARYERERKFIFFPEMSAQLPKLRKEDPKLIGVPHRAAQMDLQRYEHALKAFLTGMKEGTIKETAAERERRKKRRAQRYAIACAKAERAGEPKPTMPPAILDAKGFPQFKRKGEDGFSFVGKECRFRMSGKQDRRGWQKISYIFFPKPIGWVRVRGIAIPASVLASAQTIRVMNAAANKLPVGEERKRARMAISAQANAFGNVLMVCASQQPDGWTIAVQFLGPVREYATPDQPVIGSDAGIKKLSEDAAILMTLSNGVPIKHVRVGAKAEKHIRRRNRIAARRRRACEAQNRKASVNLRRAEDRLARLHRRVREQRRNRLHQISRVLIDRYAGFAIEDLSLKGLVRTRLAKSFADAALGELRRMLAYKADWAGRDWRIKARFERSTGVCPDCHWIGPRLPLHVREWTCRMCGVVHDRDTAAARAILATAEQVGRVTSEPAGATRRKRGFAVRDGGRAKARASHVRSPANLDLAVCEPSQ